MPFSDKDPVALPRESILQSAHHEAAHAVVCSVVTPRRHPQERLWDSMWIATRFDPTSWAGYVENIQTIWKLRRVHEEPMARMGEAMVKVAGPLYDVLRQDGGVEAVAVEWQAVRNEAEFNGTGQDWETAEEVLGQTTEVDLDGVVKATLEVLGVPEVRRAIESIATRLLGREPGPNGRHTLEWDEVVDLLPNVSYDLDAGAITAAPSP